MNRQKYISINGVTFEIKKSLMVGDAIAWDIDEAYSRPSYIKREIWKGWKKWAEEIHEIAEPENWCSIWISGKNSCTYTIGGYCEMDGNLYKIKITKEHRYIREI